MKRQPMCVYHIREVLTGSRNPSMKTSAIKKTSRQSETLQVSGASLTSTYNMEYSLVYGEEVPVGEFLAKSTNMAQHQRRNSVPVDVHEVGSWSDDSFQPSDVKDLSTDEFKSALGELQKSSTTAQQVPCQQTDELSSECNGN